MTEDFRERLHGSRLTPDPCRRSRHRHESDEHATMSPQPPCTRIEDPYCSDVAPAASHFHNATFVYVVEASRQTASLTVHCARDDLTHIEDDIFQNKSGIVKLKTEKLRHDLGDAPRAGCKELRRVLVGCALTQGQAEDELDTRHHRDWRY